MVTFKVGQLPFYLPSNQILYIEKEYNEFLNSCFSHTDEFENLFSHYYSTLNRDVFLDKCSFIYIPKLVETWDKDISDNKNLESTLLYNYPSLNVEAINKANILKVDTTLYTKFLMGMFDSSVSEQITNGLLLYIPSSKELVYCPLLSQNMQSLSLEIGTFFYELRDKYKDYFENFAIPVTPSRDDVPDEEKADYDFTYRNRIANEIRERIELLRESGHEDLLLKLIAEEILKIDREDEVKSAAKHLMFHLDAFKGGTQDCRIEKFKKYYLTEELSPIVIDEEFRIWLSGYNNLEIKLTPLQKTVYFLFLRHPEGILFKELRHYKNELQSIYCDISNRECLDGIEKSIEDICNPVENSINEKCSRIKEAFLSQFKDEIAGNYYITGDRGCPKLIRLDRTLVQWNVRLSFDDKNYVVIRDVQSLDDL